MKDNYVSGYKKHAHPKPRIVSATSRTDFARNSVSLAIHGQPVYSFADQPRESADGVAQQVSERCCGVLCVLVCVYYDKYYSFEETGRMGGVFK